jgi:hypothetical protein
MVIISLMMEMEKAKGVSISTALDFLERVETELAELYGRLAERFADHEPARKLFSRLQFMESSHANVVRFQKRLVMQERKFFGNSDIDVSTIARALELIKNMKTREPGPGLEETLALLLELDAYACDRCYRNAIIQANPTLAGIVNSMSSDDARAGIILREFADRHGLPI